MLEGSHSFTCHPHVYPRIELAILPLPPAAEHYRTLAGTPFPSHGGQEAELAWVSGYIIPRWYACQKTVTHPSTNRGRRGVTSSIRSTTFTLRQTARHVLFFTQSYSRTQVVVCWRSRTLARRNEQSLLG